MLGKLKSIIDDTYRRGLNYFCVKGCIVNITGTGVGTDPNINFFYNISDVIWISTGVYYVLFSQATIYGVDVASNSSISCTWNIAPNASTDAFKVDAVPAAGFMILNVYQLTISGGKIIRTLIDLESSDKVSLTLVLNGGAELPPV